MNDNNTDNENTQDGSCEVKLDPVQLAEQRRKQEALAAERRALAEQHKSALHKLGTLQTAAAALAQEWTALLATQENYELLEHACETLEKLSEQGVAALFWGEQASDATASQYIQDARTRADVFRGELQALEDRHQLALDEVEDQQDILDIIEYDLYQALQREESSKQEWIIERQAAELPTRLLAMPWMRGFEEDRFFRRTLAASMLTGLLLGIIVPLFDLPIVTREDAIEVPERFAKLIRKAPEEPPPAPQPLRQEKPEEVAQEEVEPEEPVEQTPEVEVAVAAEPKSTREKVNSVGILAFRENFSSLKDTKPSAQLGSAARVTEAGESAVGRPERAMVTALGSGSSGGINLAAISRDINGGGAELVEGVQVTRVESSIGGGGPDDRPRSAGAVAGRTDEEIQIVFDRYKAALYRLYNRELRKDPTLRGQMVLRLTIEPDGSVSLCQLQSSDMEAPSLAQQVVSSVSGFLFGEKDVPAITILYPIDFLPTA